MKKITLNVGASIIFALFSVFLSFNSNATIISSAATGDWAAIATWTGGIVPGATDTVQIAAMHTVTIQTGTITVARLEVLTNTSALPANKGLTLATGATLTVTGDVTNQGGNLNTLPSIITNNGIFNVGGLFTLIPTNTQVLTNGGDPATAIFINNGIANLSSLTMNASTNSNLEFRCLTGSTTNFSGDYFSSAATGYTFLNINGTAIVNFTGTASVVINTQFAEIVFTGAGKLNMLGNDSDLKLTGVASQIRMGNAASEIHLKGQFTVLGTPAFTAGTASTVFYDGTVQQVIAPVNYRNLVSTSTGVREISQIGIVGIAGNFTRGTNNYLLANSTINYNGTAAQYIEKFDYFNLTISGARGGANITLCPDTIGLAGIFVYSATGVGAVVNTNNTFKFNGSIDQEMQLFNFNNILVDKPNGSVCFTRINGNTVITGSLTVETGVFRIGRKATTIVGQSAPYTFATTGANQTLWVKKGSRLEVDGSSAFAAPYPMSFATNLYEDSSTLHFSSNLNQTIPAGLNLYNLRSSVETGNGVRILSPGITQIRGDFFDDGSNTYTTTGSEVIFNGTKDQKIAGSVGLGASALTNVTVEKATGKLILGAATTVNGLLSLKEGKVDLNGKEMILALADSSAIVRLNGAIICDSNDFASKLTWNIGANTTMHEFPFVTKAGAFVPVKFKLASGDASNITISTYGTGANNTPLPPTVTGIAGQNLSDTANLVADRFWSITASNTVIAKAATVTFNTRIPEALGIDSMKARMWNGTVWDAATANQTSTNISTTTPGLTGFGIFALYGAVGNANPTDFFSNKTAICAGDTAKFIDNSFTTVTAWEWTFTGAATITSTQQNPFVVYNTPGTYSVKLKITHTGGVDSLTRPDYITVYASPLIDAGSDVAICAGESVDLTATGTQNYLWDTGATTATISVSPSVTTTYKVTGDDGGICAAKDQVKVTVNEIPVATINFTQDTVCKTATVTFDGTSTVAGSAYNWNFDGGASNGTTSQSHTISWATIGDKNILLTVSKGNCSSDAVTKLIYVNECGLGLEEMNNVSFSVYPNPASTKINVQYELNGDLKEIAVYTASGQKVISSTSNEIDVQSLSNGIYFVKVTTSNGVGNEKLNIQK
jgi:PKD repeat protein